MISANVHLLTTLLINKNISFLVFDTDLYQYFAVPGFNINRYSAGKPNKNTNKHIVDIVLKNTIFCVRFGTSWIW